MPISCAAFGLAIAIRSRLQEVTLSDFDSPWKEALDVYFQPFIALTG